MIALVVLSMDAPEFRVETLRARLDRVFPDEFLPPREKGTFVVEGPVVGAQFLINSAIKGAAGTYLLNSVPGPYTDFSDFAAHIADPELRRLAIAQEAWLSVDRIAGDKPRDAHRFIGKVIAEVAPADSAVLVDPASNRCWRFDENVRRRLAEGAEKV